MLYKCFFFRTSVQSDDIYHLLAHIIGYTYLNIYSIHHNPVEFKTPHLLRGRYPWPLDYESVEQKRDSGF